MASKRFRFPESFPGRYWILLDQPRNPRLELS